MVAFVLLTCLRVWLGPVDLLPRARGQIPDSGLQRRQLLEAVRESNEQLRQILSVLKSGTLNVRLVSTDKKVAAGGLAPAGQKR